MKKYTKPEVDIELYNNEDSIMVSSAGDTTVSKLDKVQFDSIK